MEEMIDTNETTEQEVVEYNPQAIMTIPGFNLPANATPQERRAMARVVSAFIGESKSMWDMHNTVVSVRGAMIHPVRITDMNSGEVVDKLRVVWLLEDGTCISGVSGVTKQFTEMVLLPFFNNGKQGLFEFQAVVSIKAQKTNKGFKTYSFSLVGE